MEINGFVSRTRLITLGVLLAAISLFVVVKYGITMLGPEPIYAEAGTIPERGAILDRNGKILAIQSIVYNIAVTRSAIKDAALFAQLMAPLTGIPEGEILNKLGTSGSDFFYLKKKIPESDKNSIAEVISRSRLRGVRLEPVQSRIYPEKSLASQIIGFLGDDGYGLTGAEYSFQETLAPGITAAGKAKEAFTVQLTLDSAMQYELEKIARDTMAETKAEAMILLAVDAKSGKILSYVSEPSADLATYPLSSDSERMDRPALYRYEPGSVFKIFSIAAFLELGAVSDGDQFMCDGAYSFTTPGGERISIGDLAPHGIVTPRDVIRLSCNDGTAQMSERVDETSFESKLRSFGFGSKTGIELPGETAGYLSPHAQWSLRSKPTIAIGQEMSVSALQMVEAATAIANRGTRLKLTILSRVLDRDGTVVYEQAVEPAGSPLSARTAELMLSYMQSTAESGTGTKAAVGDVPIAVKTGTAQMVDTGAKTYSETDFVSSCLGIFPADDPRVILYTVIFKPVGETWGGRIAAPVVSLATNVIIDQLGLGRGSAVSVRHTGLVPIPKTEPVKLGAIMPDLTGVPKRMLTPLLERSDLKVRIDGDGYVIWQSPEPGTPVEKGMSVELRLE